MAVLARLVFMSLCAGAWAQYAEERAPRYIATGASEQKVAPAPPVAILKQINRHNEDGSYTYGYEGADGSFKIETKSPTGEVKGKYGYKDDTGKVRVVEYGANKFGFQPSGEGITVAPPTLVDETKNQNQDGSRPQKQQGGRSQYRAPAQEPDYDYEEPAPAPPPRRPAPQPQYRQQSAPAPAPPRPAFFAGAAPAPAQQDTSNFFNPAPQQPRQQQYKPKQDFRQPQLHTQTFSPKPQIEYSQSFAPQQQQNFASQNPQNFGLQNQQNFGHQNQQSFAPQQQQFSPAQFPQQRSNQQPFSMLDQLLKEYALPQGGAAPLHDITFGSF